MVFICEVVRIVMCLFFFSSRRRHTRCALVTGVQTCALPISLRNRILSTAHEPAYSEDGLPKERYRLYHAEKARGGIALTMTAGSAVVSRDSPEAFGNLHAYKDEIVPWLQALSDACHEHGAAVKIGRAHV